MYKVVDLRERALSDARDHVDGCTNLLSFSRKAELLYTGRYISNRHHCDYRGNWMLDHPLHLQEKVSIFQRREGKPGENNLHTLLNSIKLKIVSTLPPLLGNAFCFITRNLISSKPH